MLAGGIPEVPSPNERTKEIRTQLMIYIYAFGINLIFKFFVGFFPLQDIMCGLLLWCGHRSLNYCYVSFFVLMTFFSFFQIFNSLGGAIQNGTPLFNRKNGFASFVLISSIVIYLWGYYICLIAYREFKALMKEGQVQGGMGMAQMATAGRDGRNGAPYMRQ